MAQRKKPSTILGATIPSKSSIVRSQSEPKLSAENKFQQRVEWIQSFFGAASSLPLRRRINIIQEPLAAQTFGKKIAWANSSITEGDMFDLVGSSAAQGQLTGIGSDGKKSTLQSEGFSNGSSQPGNREADESVLSKAVCWTQHMGGPQAHEGLSTRKRRSSMLLKNAKTKIFRNFDDKLSDSTCVYGEKLTDEQVVDTFRRCTEGKMEALAEATVLVEMWSVAGYQYGVNTQWIAKAIDDELGDESTRASFVETDNFIAIWNSYFDKLRDFQMSIFTKVCERRQTVSEAQLPAMFHELGFWPMPGALVEAEQSVMRTSKDDLSKPCLAFEDFVSIYDELYSRAGLTRSECKHAIKIFEQHVDANYTLSSTATRAALKAIEPHFIMTRMQPYILPDCLLDALTHEVVTQVAEQRLSVDMDAWSHVLETTERFEPKKGVINKSAFLVVCNLMHQCVADHLESVVERIGLLSVRYKFSATEDVPNLFDELGHVSPDINLLLQEILEDCGMKGKKKLSFGEVYTVLLVFCNLEAFTRAERDDLMWMFDVFSSQLPDVDKDSQGRISTSEVLRLLRWQCYTPSPHRFYDFMDKYGRDEANYMDLHEFMKVVSDYRYANVGMARSAFRSTEELPDGKIRSTWQPVGISTLPTLMTLAGHACSTAELCHLEEQATLVLGKITWREFLRLEALYRNDIRQTLTQNQGFTDMERAGMRETFSQYTIRNCDAILFGGFEKLVVKYIPHIKIDEKLRQLIKESDLTHTNKIEFTEFLWIMRRLFDKDARETMTRARQLREELGYSKVQVQELRELFKITDIDLSGNVDISELSVLFAGLVDMSGNADKDLLAHLRKEIATGDEEAIDFFGFLRLMKTLESCNWRNINRLSENQVRTGEVNSDEHVLMFKTKSVRMTEGSGHELML